MKKRNANTNKPKKTFLSQSKINLYNFIVSTLAMIISLFAYCNESKQTDIQYQQLEAQKKENQPNFQVYYKIEKVNNDSIDDTELIHVENTGREAKYIEIQNYVYIKVEVWGDSIIYSGNDCKKQTASQHVRDLYIPISGYFNEYTIADSIKSYITIDNWPNNFKMYNDLIKCLNDQKDSYKYECTLDKYALISYQDIYDRYHKVCFKNGIRFDSLKELNELRKESLEIYHFDQLLHTLTCEDIYEFIKMGMAHK